MEPETDKKQEKKNPYKQELSDAQKNEIKEAFDMFDTAGMGVIEDKELKVALRALGFTPTKDEIKSLISQSDKDNSMRVDFQQFLDILILKMSEKDSQAELDKAFALFDHDQDGYISLTDLQHVAAELGEEMSNDELVEMIRGANKGDADIVNPSNFAQILQKSNTQ